MNYRHLLVTVATLFVISPATALRMPRSDGEILAATDVVVTGTITKVIGGRGGQFEFSVADTVFGKPPAQKTLTLRSGYDGCNPTISYVPGTAMLLFLDEHTTGPYAGTFQLSMEESRASVRIPSASNPPPAQYDSLKDLDIAVEELQDALTRRAEIRAATIELIAASRPANRDAVWKLLTAPGQKLQAIAARSEAHKAIIDKVISEIANCYWYREGNRRLPTGEAAIAPDIIKAFIQPADIGENP